MRKQGGVGLCTSLATKALKHKGSLRMRVDFVLLGDLVSWWQKNHYPPVHFDLHTSRAENTTVIPASR